MTTYENFEIFWEKYPKKVGKKPSWMAFKNKNKKDIPVIMEGLEKYNKKWELEKTPKNYIPDPRTFLSQERYYDEIIIIEDPDEQNFLKKQNEKIEQLKEEQKKEILKNKEAQKEKQKIDNIYNNLDKNSKKIIYDEANRHILDNNSYIYARGGEYLSRMRDIIIRTIIQRRLSHNEIYYDNNQYHI